MRGPDADSSVAPLPPYPANRPRLRMRRPPLPATTQPISDPRSRSGHRLPAAKTDALRPIEASAPPVAPPPRLLPLLRRGGSGTPRPRCRASLPTDVTSPSRRGGDARTPVRHLCVPCVSRAPWQRGCGGDVVTSQSCTVTSGCGNRAPRYPPPAPAGPRGPAAPGSSQPFRLWVAQRRFF